MGSVQGLGRVVVRRSYINSLTIALLIEGHREEINMAKKKLTIEDWRVRRAKQRVYEYQMNIEEGIRRGRKQAEDEFKDKLRLLEVKEHCLRAMAQMMEAAAHLADNLHGL